MRNTFGNSLTVTLFGESHNESIGTVIDGLPSGIQIDKEFIKNMLNLRRGEADISTPRREEDNFKIVSGVKDGFTCGTPLCIIIENGDINSAAYEESRYFPRPSHADFVNFVRQGGKEDYRGGGHSSGRLTAPLTAAGAIVLSALNKKGINIVTKIDSINGIKDKDFENIKDFCLTPFPVADKKCGEEMRAEIKAAKEAGDSVGGTLKTVVSGLPVGVGEPFFTSAESHISSAVFSVPGVKGIEFGEGFAFSKITGGKALEEMEIKYNKPIYKTAKNGGIIGGMTTGTDVTFRTVIKPTPSVSLPQKTVDLKKSTEKTMEFSGRHDPCIVPRAAIVLTAVTALSVADLLCLRYGNDWLKL